MTAYTSLPCDERVIASGVSARAPCAASAQRWVLAASIVASSMAFVDGTVVNVALPALQRELGATLAQAQWVVEAYTLALAALLLAAGAAADVFGRRRVFSLGVALFGLASIACALAPDPRSLIVARTVQGVGAAMLVPVSLALVSAAYAGDARGRAIGTWSAFTAITSAIGPVLGGFLIDHLSWRYAFVINVPLAIVVVAIVVRRVPASVDAPPTDASHVDWPGAVLATIGLAGVVFALVEAAARGWNDPWVLVALATGVIALGVFFVVETKRASPMLPLDLLRDPVFASANLLTLALYAALGGALFFLPLDLIQVQGYSTAAAGAALLPFTVMMVLLSRWSGRVVDRYGARLPLAVGPTIAGLGFGLLAMPGVASDYWTTFFPGVVVLGLGMAICVAPLTTTVMNAVPATRAGTASGVNNAVARVAGLVAVAAFGLVAAHAFDSALVERLASLDVPTVAREAVLAERTRMAAIRIPADLPEETRSALEGTIRDAFVHAFRIVMLAGAMLAFLAGLVGWWTPGGAHGPPLPRRA